MVLVDSNWCSTPLPEDCATRPAPEQSRAGLFISGAGADVTRSGIGDCSRLRGHPPERAPETLAEAGMEGGRSIGREAVGGGAGMRALRACS